MDFIVSICNCTSIYITMIEKLRAYFNWDKQEDQPSFYLHEGHKLFVPFEKYYSVINKHLERRDEAESYTDKLYEVREFQDREVMYYELEMILDIFKTSDYLIPLDRIQHLDSYHMGHIDYVNKFALGLAEEEERKLNEK